MTFPAGLLEAFETAQRSVFRLETLQHYAGDPQFDRFQAGLTWEDNASKDHWCDIVRRRTADGVAFQRVHVVSEPLTDYMRFELTRSYPPNTEAGEDVRVLRAAPGQPRWWDFWMFDERQVWAMHYGPRGTLTAVTEVKRPRAHLLDWRERALAESMPLTEYMAHA